MVRRSIGIIQTDTRGNQWFLGRVTRKVTDGMVEIASMTHPYSPLMSFTYEQIDKIRDIKQVEYLSNDEALVGEVAVKLHNQKSIDLEEEDIEYLHRDDYGRVLFDWEGHTGMIVEDLDEGFREEYAEYLQTDGYVEDEYKWGSFKLTDTDIRMIKADLHNSETGNYEFVEEEYGLDETGLINYYRDMFESPDDLNVGYVDYDEIAEESLSHIPMETIEQIHGEIYTLGHDFDLLDGYMDVFIFKR